MTLAPRYCDALCADMVTQFLVLWSARSCSAFRQLRETVRASWTNWYSDTRGLYVQKLCGWVLGYARLSFERRGVVPRFTDIGMQRRCRLSFALVVAEPRTAASAGRVARRNSFEIQTARSVCTAVRAVLRKDARQMHTAVDSGLRREFARDVRTSKLRPCPGCNGSHGIVAALR